jgi:hypothetical protein
MSSPTAIIVKDINGEEKEFLIDASISINTSIKAKVTSYPVEDGNFISDHVQPEPLMLSIDGIISQSPSSFFLSVVNATAGFIAGQASSLTGLSSAFASAAVASGLAAAATQGNTDLDTGASFVKLLLDRGVADNEFPKKAMLGLVRMFNDGSPFKVRTFFSDVIYTNMVATSITFPQDAKIGDSLKFKLTCVKVNIVTSKVDIGGKGELEASDPAGSSATPNKDKGGIDGSAAKIAPSGESFLNSLFGG